VNHSSYRINILEDSVSINAAAMGALQVAVSKETFDSISAVIWSENVLINNVMGVYRTQRYIQCAEFRGYVVKVTMCFKRTSVIVRLV
jgi:hypothetical protein